MVLRPTARALCRFFVFQIYLPVLFYTDIVIGRLHEWVFTCLHAILPLVVGSSMAAQRHVQPDLTSIVSSML